MDLKRELTEAGNQLLRPPDDVDELLGLLDRVEHSLSFVEQQPVEGIQNALCPTFKALISTQLLKHPDTDVRVGVAACITEISRITAPDVPYNDDVMKVVFRLTFSALKGLSDNSSKSFSKRVSILEIVARVRSCAVLLDLECDDLVVDMFMTFYKGIRDFHSAIVFASMESIMTLIIEDSEEISTSILFALLSVLRKDNKDALPIARKLGEKVVQNCAAILKPCILEAIKSLKINLLDYDFVVTMACQMTQDHKPPKYSVQSAPLVHGSETAALVDDVIQEVLAPSNGNTEVMEDATMEMINTSNKTNSVVVIGSAEIIQDQVQTGQDTPKSAKAINPESVSSVRPETKSEKVAKKRGRKPKVTKEIILQTDSGKDEPDIVVDSVSLTEVKKEQDNDGEPEDTPRMQSSLQLGVTDGTPKSKKRGRPRKDASMVVAIEVKDKVSPETTINKRSRHSAPLEDGKEYGEELVGSRIKVWWPHDKRYYDGVVESFDPVKKKHKILYTDSEREVLNLHKQRWKHVMGGKGSEKNGEACYTNAGDSSNVQQNRKLKIDSDSVSIVGNMGAPKRRGRPPKNATSIVSNTIAGKGTTPEGQAIDSMADAVNPDNSMESPLNALPNLNDLFEGSEQEQVVSGNDGVQACVIDTVAPKEATVVIDINETLRNDEDPNLDETVIPESEHSDFNVTEQVNSGPAGTKNEGSTKDISASDTANKPRKSKAGTSSNSSSRTVLESRGTSVKRHRGRPSRLSLGTFDEKSELLKKQLGDPQVDGPMSGCHSDNLAVMNSEDSLALGRSMPDMNAELGISEHGVLGKNVTKSTDSGLIETKAYVAVEQISSKSTSGEHKSCSSTNLKLKLKTSDVEHKLRRKKARKSISSSSELKKEGFVKRSRGRPCKPKIRDPKSVISHKNGSGSSCVFKIATPNVYDAPKDSFRADVVMKDNQDSSAPAKDVDLNLDLAAKSKGDDASEKSPESEASKET